MTMRTIFSQPPMLNDGIDWDWLYGKEMNCVVYTSYMNQYLEEQRTPRRSRAVAFVCGGVRQKRCVYRCEHEKLSNNIQLQKQFVLSSITIRMVQFKNKNVPSLH